ncbi:MAG: cyclic nucleotide-binding domain-containing protein [Phycisphaera sp.]|nr:cyclic nucleotide-binding domain-containing protein [Phycisphaera sp.]
MKHSATGMSDVGMQRSHNEDALLLAGDLGLYVVCDGVGGHAAGEVASQTAVETIHKYIQRHAALLADHAKEPKRDVVTRLAEEAICEANRVVFEMSQADNDKRGMACTVVMVLMFSRNAVVAHAGDSRVYLIRDGEAIQLTEDHTLVMRKLKRGEITIEEAREQANTSQITRAVGHREFIQPDTLFMELAGDDKFLLCSDGLSEYLREGDLAATYANMAAKVTPKALIQMANERGGHDNITALTIHVQPTGAPTDNEAARKVEILRQIPLFQHLNYKDLMKVLNVASVATYEEGEQVIAEGEVDGRLFICLNGRVQVVKQDQVLAELQSGDFFGEMALIDKAPRSADVVALERSQMIRIGRENFFTLLNLEPRMGIKLLWPICRVLNHRLRVTSNELATFKNTMPEILDSTMPAAADEELQLLADRSTF